MDEFADASHPDTDGTRWFMNPAFAVFVLVAYLCGVGHEDDTYVSI